MLQWIHTCVASEYVRRRQIKHCRCGTQIWLLPATSWFAAGDKRVGRRRHFVFAGDKSICRRRDLFVVADHVWPLTPSNIHHCASTWSKIKCICTFMWLCVCVCVCVCVWVCVCVFVCVCVLIFILVLCLHHAFVEFLGFAIRMRFPSAVVSRLSARACVRFVRFDLSQPTRPQQMFNTKKT